MIFALLLLLLLKIKVINVNISVTVQKKNQDVETDMLEFQPVSHFRSQALSAQERQSVTETQSDSDRRMLFNFRRTWKHPETTRDIWAFMLTSMKMPRSRTEVAGLTESRQTRNGVRGS